MWKRSILTVEEKEESGETICGWRFWTFAMKFVIEKRVTDWSVQSWASDRPSMWIKLGDTTRATRIPNGDGASKQFVASLATKVCWMCMFKSIS